MHTRCLTVSPVCKTKMQPNNTKDGPTKSPMKCAGCLKRIRSRFFLEALGKFWHERCFSCDICHEVLYSFGEKYYFKNSRKLCKMDYMRLYVPGGICSMCSNTIPSTENAIKFGNNVNYHVQCFRCVVCHYQFSKGDVTQIPQPNIVLCYQHGIEYNLLRSLASQATPDFNNAPTHVYSGQDIESNNAKMCQAETYETNMSCNGFQQGALDIGRLEYLSKQDFNIL